MTDPKPSGFKTLGVKIENALHSQLVMVAALDSLTLNDAILRAIELYIEGKRADGTLAARAAEALAEMERESAARRAAIEALLGGGTASPAADVAAPDEASQPRARSRRSDSAK